MAANVLTLFHAPVASWFSSAFAAPTRPQRQGWPAIARGDSTLILAPTGTGKTLTAFLACLDRLMFAPVPDRDARCRVLYLSPLKALAVDVERNLRAPLAGIAHVAAADGVPYHLPQMSIRTGDTPAAERTRFQRDPADILITTPESLFLLLTSNARARLRTVDTVIVDEIHALVSTKRGAHMACRSSASSGWSIGRCSASGCRPPSATSTRLPASSAARPPPGRDAPSGRRPREVAPRRRCTPSSPRTRPAWPGQ